MKTRLFVPLLLALSGVLDAAPAIRPEFSLALVKAYPAMKTDYVHRYVPPFFDIGALVSSSTAQTLSLSAADAGTYSPSVAVFFGGRLGLRLSTVGFETPVSGTTTPDVVSVTYTSRQPPDYVPRQYSVTIEGSMPAPEGALRTRAYSLDLIWRLVMPGRFAVDLSGGLSLLRLDADLKTLGYRRFWLGGHSVLFSTEAELRMETDAATRVGVDLGITAAVHISREFALFLEGRYILGPKTGLPVRFILMDSADDYYPGSSELTGLSDASPFEVNPSFLTLSAGFRIALF